MCGVNTLLMSILERTSIELPSAASGSKELIAWPGVTSTRTVPVCLSDGAVCACAGETQTGNKKNSGIKDKVDLNFNSITHGPLSRKFAFPYCSLINFSTLDLSSVRKKGSRNQTSPIGYIYKRLCRPHHCDWS